jgi:hypothetical protein
MIICQTRHVTGIWLFDLACHKGVALEIYDPAW